jgi:hypothetical protein
MNRKAKRTPNNHRRIRPLELEINSKTEIPGKSPQGTKRAAMASPKDPCGLELDSTGLLA